MSKMKQYIQDCLVLAMAGISALAWSTAVFNDFILHTNLGWLVVDIVLLPLGLCRGFYLWGQGLAVLLGF